MLHCLAADARDIMCDVSAAVQGIKTFKNLPNKKTDHTRIIPLAPLAFWSQRGDSVGHTGRMHVSMTTQLRFVNSMIPQYRSIWGANMVFNGNSISHAPY
jgi:hypothetical protein